MNEIEAAIYERRRLLAALLVRAEPPPGVLGALVVGSLVGLALVAGVVAQRWW